MPLPGKDSKQTQPTPRPAGNNPVLNPNDAAAIRARAVQEQAEFRQNTPQNISSESDKSMAELQAQLEEARAQNEALHAKVAAIEEAAQRKMYLKVSEKGALSLYGLGRFPVTLYAEQWIDVLNFGDTIKAYLAEHQSSFKTKADAAKAAQQG